MKKSIKIIASIVLSVLCLGTVFYPTTTTYADDVCSSSAAPEVKKAAGCSGTSDQLPEVIQGILNAIILILGIVAVVFIIIGGVKYMTSTGNSEKTKEARNTILYAVIGLIVCVLAFAIVNFVIINILKQ